MRSLMVKLIAAFLLISVLGMVLAGVFIREFVGREFDDYVIAQRRATFINNARSYYTLNGSWEGVERWLFSRAGFRRPGAPYGEGHPPAYPGQYSQQQYDQQVSFVLLDDAGRVVVPFGPYSAGALVAKEKRADGDPIVVDGQLVGTVLTPERTGFRNTQEELYLKHTTWALGAATAIAVVLALLVGGLLARLITRPLRELTVATQNMAGGALHQQVPVRSQDEIGVLAAQFNRMSAELARSHQLRRQMTADIAHDLRTPLTVLSGYLESLRDEVLRPTPQRFATLYAETQILLRLVEDLHTLSLADAGELSLSPRPAPPRQLLEHVASTYHHVAEQQGVTLQVDDATDDTPIVVDFEQMARALSNLVSNALRYTPAGGGVTLSARRWPDAAELRVSDTGPGIPPEHLQNIFERFYRADSSRQQETGGSGLGLAIVRSIVELHGGTVAASSAPGQGASFTIRLPIRLDSAPDNTL